MRRHSPSVEANRSAHNSEAAEQGRAGAGVPSGSNHRCQRQQCGAHSRMQFFVCGVTNGESSPNSGAQVLKRDHPNISLKINPVRKILAFSLISQALTGMFLL